MVASQMARLRRRSKPLVFISASRRDSAWRELLKSKIDELNELEWWDDTKITPAQNWAEIEAAIQRAAIAVIFLSSAYLSSDTSIFELRRLGQEAASKKLKLFPIVLDDCIWGQYEFLRNKYVWDNGRPLGNLNDRAADKRFGQIAARILEIVKTGGKQGEDSESKLHFSPAAQEVLGLARSFAERSKRDRITSSCLLFASAEWPSHITSQFIAKALDQKGRYQAQFEAFLKDGEPSTVPPVSLPGVPGNLTKNVSRVLTRAHAIAVNVSGSGQIHARHLFAALISLQVPGSWSLRDRLERLGVELPTLCLEFRGHIGNVARLESRTEWDAILGFPKPPASKSSESEISTHVSVADAAAIDPVKDPIFKTALTQELESVDFYIAQGYADITSDTLDMLEKEFGAHPDIQARRLRVAELLKGEQPSTTSNAQDYKSTYSAFIPDRAPYGARASNAPLDDSLGVRTYAGHLAQLIAAKETFMPLSIGLFGAWGAGKSHFIDLLDEQLCQLTKDEGKAFHKHIVQIRFNAWHYLDTNLWANLVSEIFDQLFASLEGGNEQEAQQLENLKNQLADQSALAAEAKAALSLAESVRREAETKLRSAMTARAREEETVSALLDDLKNLVITDDVKKQLRDVAQGLGLPKVETSFKELEARAEEVRSLGGRTRALLLALFTGPGWWRRALPLVVALLAPLGVAWLAKYGGPFFQELLAGAGGIIAQLVTAIAAISTWVATQAKAGNAVVSKLEAAYDRVKTVRAAREAQDDAARAQAELAQKKQAEDEARHTLHEAEEKLKAIRAELAEMAPGRQLIRFLRERASAEDYRRHLGLVSLVRKDFEQLSKLLIDVPSEGGELPKIDRIVLYIDDLDRCRADRVIEVLEAVHLLLAFPLFAVVVAVDPRWLRQSLLDHYPRLLGGAEDEKANSRQRSVGRPATPQDYLEKIFQVPFNLHAMEKTGFESLVKHLFSVDDTGKQPEEFTVTTSHTLASQNVSLPEAPSEEAPIVDLQTPATDDPSTVSVSIGPMDITSLEAESPSPDPERLVLTRDEVADVQRFQLLFQTPRAVKRLANTYSLIRVGVDKDEWTNYLGSHGSLGDYRVPLLLLAVTSAFPALARPWLLWLSDTTPIAWQLEDASVEALAAKHNHLTDHVDWERLQHCLNRLDLEGWPPPDREALDKWLPRVARYSF